jgi:hypothetical protein
LKVDADWNYQSDFDNAQLGYAVSSAGDVNGDGYADVIFGARYYSQTVHNEGGAMVFYGSLGGLSAEPDWIATGGQSGSGFGSAVSGAGDVNGDGFDDVLIGAPGYDGDGGEMAGAAFIYLGAADGLSATPVWSLYGENPEGRFGHSVAAAGDVNGDGIADVVISAPEYAGEGELLRGLVAVYYGHSGSTGDDLSLRYDVLLGDRPLVRFGDALAPAGDVNQDGYADVLVGAYQYDDDQPDEGRTFIYPGGPLGLAPVPVWYVDGDIAEASLGYSLASGDINQDGQIDILVGAPYYRLNLSNVGRVFAYYGQPGFYGDLAQIFLPVVVH